MKVHLERMFIVMLVIDILSLIFFGTLIAQTDFKQRPDQILPVYFLCGMYLLMLGYTVYRYFHEERNYLIFDNHGITEVKNNHQSIIPWESVDFAAIFYVLTNSAMLIYVKDEQGDPDKSTQKFYIRNTKKIRSCLSQYVRVIDPKNLKNK